MTRNKEQNNRIKEERRLRILNGALKLFARRGLEATRIADIAHETNMSLGLIYHYYHDKEALYGELIASAFEKLISACHFLEAMDKPVREKIPLAINGLLKVLTEQEDAALNHLLIAQASASDATPQEVKQCIAHCYPEPYRIMADIMRQGQAEGSVRDYPPEALAMLFWTTLNGIAIYKASHGAHTPSPDGALIASMFLKPDATVSSAKQKKRPA